jgi:RHS repeat-associated protein
VTYLHADQLWSTAETTGQATSEQLYYPYGSQRTVDEVSTTRRYTGQRWEEAIGLYDYEARYYDPELGRFVQPDSIVPELANPQYLNRYSYVLNNPLRYTDSTGHASDCAEWIKEQLDRAIQWFTQQWSSAKHDIAYAGVPTSSGGSGGGSSTQTGYDTEPTPVPATDPAQTGAPASAPDATGATIPTEGQTQPQAATQPGGSVDWRGEYEALPTSTEAENIPTKWVTSEQELLEVYRRWGREGSAVQWKNYGEAAVQLPDGTEMGLRYTPAGEPYAIDINVTVEGRVVQWKVHVQP